MKIGNREFKLGSRTYVCGILNLTPDSFSDGGKYNRDTALFQVEKMVKEGADLIDIGGQSTKPGYKEISEDEEISRVIPVITDIKKNFDIPISIDTYKIKVADAAAGEGVDLINDIWGIRGNRSVVEMTELAAKKNLPICLMHNRENNDYNDFFEDLKNDLKNLTDTALFTGVKKENIILDPGVGFAKNHEQNLLVLNRLSELKDMGYPLLLGCSRKSVIGNVLKLPVECREEGTLVTTVLAVQAGFDFVRVHDVEKNVRAIRMMESIRDIKEVPLWER